MKDVSGVARKIAKRIMEDLHCRTDLLEGVDEDVLKEMEEMHYTIALEEIEEAL